LSGIAHNLARLQPHVEQFTGKDIDEIALVGGDVRSRGAGSWPTSSARRWRVAEPDKAVARRNGAARTRTARRLVVRGTERQRRI
jgi:hypothetical protein